MMQTVVTLLVTHSKPLTADFAQRVAGRAYPLDHVENVEVLPSAKCLIALPVVDGMRDER